MNEVRDYCFRCKTTQPVSPTQHATGTEWKCNVCGWQTDFDFDDEFVDYADDNYEPVGSCEDCGTNLYEDDDSLFCDQCLWHRTIGIRRGTDDA